jgi:hypothetical protein
MDGLCNCHVVVKAGHRQESKQVSPTLGYTLLIVKTTRGFNSTQTALNTVNREKHLCTHGQAIRNGAVTVFIVLPETLRCHALTTNSQHGSSHHNTADLKRYSSYEPLLRTAYFLPSLPHLCLPQTRF